MVKGISRQVIVVHSPDQKLFDQAIFILKDSAVGREGVTDEALLREARKILADRPKQRKQNLRFYGLTWALGGALMIGMIWLLTALI